MLIPPTVTAAWIPLTASTFDVTGPCALLFSPFVIMALVYNIAERLANWRHSEATRNCPPGTPPPNRESFVRWRFARYFLLQLVGSGLALLICWEVLRWLIHIGVLPRPSFS